MIRETLREIVCPVMWAEFIAIALFVGAILLVAP